jgi:hypothetical protein
VIENTLTMNKERLANLIHEQTAVIERLPLEVSTRATIRRVLSVVAWEELPAGRQPQC